MAERIECVFLTCFAAEFSTLATVLQFSGIRAHRAETLEEADFYLTVTGATVLMTDVLFLDGNWRDALGMVAATHPLAAALVAADEVDWPFLSDAYRLGACGVLWKPINYAGAIESIRRLNQAARDRAEWLAERPALRAGTRTPAPGAALRRASAE
jgi:DNA-binding NtrC family response regulator